MLQRFVHEHERVTTQVIRVSRCSGRDAFNIQCDVLEVNVEDLSANCITKDYTCTAHNKDLQSELNRLVKEKKAKCVIECVQIPIKAHETGRARSNRELPVSLATADGSVHESREPGTTVEISVIPMTKELLKVQIMTETSAKNPETVTTLAGVNVSGITTQRMQSTIEIHPGEAVVQASPTTVNGHRRIVLVKVHSKVDVRFHSAGPPNEWTNSVPARMIAFIAQRCPVALATLVHTEFARFPGDQAPSSALAFNQYAVDLRKIHPTTKSGQFRLSKSVEDVRYQS